MKRSLILIILLFFSTSAQAMLAPAGDQYFKDDGTGYTWRKINSFFGMSYIDMLQSLDVSFHVATTSEIMQMHSATYPLDFDYLYSTMGGATYQNNESIIGIYEPNITQFNAASLDAYDGQVANQNQQWTYAPHDFADFTQDQPLQNVGLWANNGGMAKVHNPEPATFLLLSGGLLTMLRRRRNV